MIADTFDSRDIPVQEEQGSSMLPPGFTMESLGRLREAIKQSKKRTEKFRDKRREMVKLSVGMHYSDDGAKTSQPLNMIRLGLDTFNHELAANLPQVLVTAKNSQLQSIANFIENDTNNQIKQMQLDEILQEGVNESMVGLGVVKVWWSYLGEEEVDGYLHEFGEPCVDIVDLDDFFIDMTAHRIQQVKFMGNRYLVPLETARNSPQYDENARAKLQATETSSIDDESGFERTDSIGRGGSERFDDFEDQVALMDVWLPRHKWLLTLPCDGSGVLRGVPWDGPKSGPYHLLLFNKVQGAVLHFPPARAWLDLHKIINSLYAKMANQAKRQKTVMPVSGGDPEDVRRLNETPDGEGYLHKGDALKEVSYGGPNQMNMAFAIQAKSLFSYVAANLDTLAGLGAQAETLGQEELIHSSASRQVQSMQEKVRRFAAGIIESIAYYYYMDPTHSPTLNVHVPGTELSLVKQWTPEDRTADFLNFNFDIEPYSMEHRTPSQKIQAIMGVIERIFSPFADLAAQQGLTLNMPELVQQVARLSRIQPELKSLIVNSGITEPEIERSGDGPARPANTTRTNIRVNRPGTGTSAGRDASMIADLMGSPKQPAERVAMFE